MIMKRKLILLIGSTICVLEMVSFLCFSKTVESDIVMQNIEALANGEVSGTVHCLGTGCVDCPIAPIRVKYIMSGWSLND